MSHRESAGAVTAGPCIEIDHDIALETIDSTIRDRLLADGLTGPRVPDALRLLVTHIDDEEYDLFPHIFHTLDPEQWEEIELAHRAVETVWDEPSQPHETS